MWVKDSDGRVWTVNRRWLPRRSMPKRWRSLIDELFGETIFGALLTFVAVVVLVVVLVLLIAQWFAVLALVPILALVRLTGLFPWVIVARRWDGWTVRATYYGEARGWLAAWRLVRVAKRGIRQSGRPDAMMP